MSRAEAVQLSATPVFIVQCDARNPDPGDLDLDYPFAMCDWLLSKELRCDGKS